MNTSPAYHIKYFTVTSPALTTRAAIYYRLATTTGGTTNRAAIVDTCCARACRPRTLRYSTCNTCLSYRCSYLVCFLPDYSKEG